MKPSAESDRYTVELRFAEDLRYLLTSETRAGAIDRTLGEKTSVKDVIESCGVPHPEIDLILCDRVPVGFEHQLTRPAVIEIFGVAASPAPFARFRLQRRRLTRFVADGHLGKLARDLRLLGFDVAYDKTAADDALARIATTEERALLTRDRRLLMRGIVQDGYCPRSPDPEAQTIEVLRRFELFEALAPYTRCVACNATVQAVEKHDVLGELEPLTRVYYREFRRCTGCGKIYWPGSHFPQLQARIARITEAADV